MTARPAHSGTEVRCWEVEDARFGSGYVRRGQSGGTRLGRVNRHSCYESGLQSILFLVILF